MYIKLQNFKTSNFKFQISNCTLPNFKLKLKRSASELTVPMRVWTAAMCVWDCIAVFDLCALLQSVV